MKTYDEIKRKAYRLYLKSFMIDNNSMASRMQARADDLLYWVLEMNTDEADEVWEAAQAEYEERMKGERV